MMTRTVLAVVMSLVATSLWADDKWEFGQGNDDTASASAAFLTHGVRQLHDLEGPAASPDQDWLAYVGEVRHSYEARVVSATLPFNVEGIGQPSAANLTRRDALGALLTQAIGTPVSPVLRWIETAQAPLPIPRFVHVSGSTSANFGPTEQYEIEMTDTTAFASRFNNAGTQATVLIVQNTTASALAGSMFFHAASGALLHTEPLAIAAYGLQVFNSTVPPALAGQSGSVTIAHTGPYGAVSGKAVALEPATGFTFDTPIVPVPR